LDPIPEEAELDEGPDSLEPALEELEPNEEPELCEPVNDELPLPFEGPTLLLDADSPVFDPVFVRPELDPGDSAPKPVFAVPAFEPSEEPTPELDDPNPGLEFGLQARQKLARHSLSR